MSVATIAMVAIEVVAVMVGPQLKLWVVVVALSWPWRSVRGSCGVRERLATVRTFASCLERWMLNVGSQQATT